MSRRALLFLAVLSGCAPWAAVTGDYEGAVGTPADGFLVSPSFLTGDPDTIRLYRGDGRQAGTPALTDLIAASARAGAAQFPGSCLPVGDLSAPSGGFITGHRSHRTGLDADLGFAARELDGRPRRGDPVIPYDRFGVALEGDDIFIFDTAKNWAVVESLLTSGDARVQWIFVSRGLKARLLRYALRSGADLALIERAAEVLHQPRDAAPHDDHFHVRICCPPDSGACEQTPPRTRCGWTAPSLADDSALLFLALEGL